MFSKLLVIVIGLIVLANSVSAQVVSGCPVVNLFGPAGLVQRGEIARYTVQVTPAEDARSLTYKWSSSAGGIKSGQGTQTVEVIQPDSCFTVTVEVGGQPEKCPILFSEAICIDWAPSPEKLGEISAALTNKKVVPIKLALDNYHDQPNVQFYFIVAGTAQKSTRNRKLEKLKRLLKNYSTRITYVLSEKTDDKIVVWAVQPGAQRPKP